jgi:hypothetical protein
MSYKKVIELAAKFTTKLSLVKKAEETEAEKLYWDSRDAHRKINLVMEEDLSNLKQRKLSHTGEFKALSKVREDVLNLFKNINPRHPYEGLGDLISWIRHETPVLQQISNLVQNHLQVATPDMPSHKAGGIPLLFQFADTIQDYLDAERNKLKPTVPPPRMR